MACHKGSQVFGSSLWFAKPEFSDADMVALANLVMDEWSSAIADSLANDVISGPFLAYDMREEDGNVVQSTIGTNGGENVNQILPLANAIVLTLRTLKRGRAYRGRIYVSGWTEAEIGETGWDAASQATIIDFATGVFAGMGPLGWTWGVRSGQLNGAVRNPAIITPISSYEVRNNTPGNQRRRNQRT